MENKMALEGIVIDSKRKKKIEISFQTKDGETVQFKDISENVVNYINNQLSKDDAGDAQILRQIYPFVASSLIYSLPFSFNSANLANIFLSLPIFREALTCQGVFMFYLLKFIRKNDLQISTTEYDLSDEEFKSFLSKAKTSQLLATAGGLGLTRDQFLQAMIETDTISESELIEAGYNKEEIVKFERGITKNDPFTETFNKIKDTKSN